MAASDELDSYMYQTVGHDAVHLVAEAMQLPLYRQVISGRPIHVGAAYPNAQADDDGPASDSHRDETEDLYELLMAVKKHHPDVQGVSAGAILSNYQRFRVETICSRPELALQPLAFLWQRNQSELLAEMVEANVEAILIKVAGIGLTQRDLGRTLAQSQAKLQNLNLLYGAHPCGEGGEYETLTLDCPLFKKRIQLNETEVVIHSDSGFATVAYLRVHRASLADKHSQVQDIPTLVPTPALLDAQGRRTLQAARQAFDSPSTGQPVSWKNTLPRLPTNSSAICSPTIAKQGAWVSFSGFSASHDNIAEAFAALRKALTDKAGLSLADVQHVNLSLSSQADFAAVNAVYKKAFGLEPPSRATVALPHLRASNSTKTITLDGWALDRGYQGSPTSSTHPLDRQALHVQSLSYWASANIGPYSQCVNAASHLTIAGQIGLRPVDLSLEEDLPTQVALSLQHARRIYEAALEERARNGKGWVEGGVVWLSGTSDIRDRIRSAAFAAWDAQSPEFESGDDDSDDDDEESSSSQNWLFGTDGVHHSQSHLDAGSARSLAHARSLPMLYAQLEDGDLPRGAAVEWQLTAHDGRRRSALERTSSGDGGDDDEDEEDASEAARPQVSSYRASLPVSSMSAEFGEIKTVTLEHSYITSQTGSSSFGVLAMRFSGEEPKTEHTASEAASSLLLDIRGHLLGALSIKTFLDLSCSGPSEGISASDPEAVARQLLRLFVGEAVSVQARAQSFASCSGLWTYRGDVKGQAAATQWQAAFVWHATAS